MVVNFMVLKSPVHTHIPVYTWRQLGPNTVQLDSTEFSPEEREFHTEHMVSEVLCGTFLFIPPQASCTLKPLIDTSVKIDAKKIPTLVQN